MKIKPQGRLEGSWAGYLLKTRPAVIASNWMFQGMRYMNVYEVSLKLVLDMIFIVFLIWLEGDVLTVCGITFIVIIAHTINWIINGHIFVLMRYIYPVPKTQHDFNEYVNGFRCRAECSGYVDGVAIYGSYCRGQLHQFSDLDVRVIVECGFVNGVLGAIFCFKERLMAFFKVFPLDLYCCAGTRCLDRLRRDENPVILLDRSGKLSRRYKIEGF